MNVTDPADEWRNLQERYSQMADEQLEGLANEAYDLTHIARDVLGSEILKRKLGLMLREAPAPVSELNPNPGDIDPETLDLVEAHRVWDKGEARSLMEVLEKAGVPCFLGLHNVAKVDDFTGEFVRGVELKVPALFMVQAASALSGVLPEKDSDSSDAPVEYRCPKCQSDQIMFEELEKESEDQPDFQAKSHWLCDGCGWKWID